jgi:hypothetical protein
MVEPFSAREPVNLEKDSNVKQLDLGNRYLRAGDLPSAVSMYRDAAASVEARADLGAMSKARVHYSFALGLALSGDYIPALDEIKQANLLSGNAKWLEFEVRIRSWQREAHRLQSQQQSDTEDAVAKNATRKAVEP